MAEAAGRNLSPVTATSILTRKIRFSPSTAQRVLDFCVANSLSKHTLRPRQILRLFGELGWTTDDAEVFDKLCAGLVHYIYDNVHAGNPLLKDALRDEDYAADAGGEDLAPEDCLEKLKGLWRKQDDMSRTSVQGHRTTTTEPQRKAYAFIHTLAILLTNGSNRQMTPTIDSDRTLEWMLHSDQAPAHLADLVLLGTSQEQQRKELERVQTELEKSEGNLSALTAEMVELKTQHGGALGELRSAQQKIVQVQQELHRAEQEVVRVQQDLQQKKEEVAALKQEHSDDLARLNGEVRMLDQKHAGALSELRGVKLELQQRKGEMAALEKEHRGDLARLSEEVRRLEQQQLTKSHSKYEQEEKEKKQRLFVEANLRHQLEQKEEEVRALERELAASADEVRACRDEVRQLKWNMEKERPAHHKPPPFDHRAPFMRQSVTLPPSFSTPGGTWSASTKKTPPPPKFLADFDNAAAAGAETDKKTKPPRFRINNNIDAGGSAPPRPPRFLPDFDDAAAAGADTETKTKPRSFRINNNIPADGSAPPLPSDSTPSFVHPHRTAAGAIDKASSAAASAPDSDSDIVTLEQLQGLREDVQETVVAGGDAAKPLNIGLG